MYNPPHFQEHRQDVLWSAIRDIQFAALVSPTPAGIEVSHVPMSLTEVGGQVYLESHVARGNGHWKAIADGAASVAIFQGPQAYVSPSWYPSKKEHGKVVPTWAYIAVHAHGRLEAIHDEDWLHSHLNSLTDANEARQPEPWQVADAPETFIGSLSRGIVGLRLAVATMEGKWKINQNKADDDRRGTALGLDNSGEDGRRLAVALRDREI